MSDATDRSAQVLALARADALAQRGADAPIRIIETNRDAFDMVRQWQYVEQHDGRYEMTRAQLAVFRAESTLGFVRQHCSLVVCDALLDAARDDRAVDIAVAVVMVGVDDEKYLRRFCELIGYDPGNWSGEIEAALVEVLNPLPVDSRGRISARKLTQAQHLIRISTARDWRHEARELVHKMRVRDVIVAPQTQANPNQREDEPKRVRLRSVDALIQSGSVFEGRELNPKMESNFPEDLARLCNQGIISRETFAFAIKRMRGMTREQIGVAEFQAGMYELRSVASHISPLWQNASSINPWPDVLIWLLSEAGKDPRRKALLDGTRDISVGSLHVTTKRVVDPFDNNRRIK